MSEARPVLFDLPGAERLWLRFAVLAIGLLMMSRDVAGPFVGKHEFNSAMYSIFARNHLRYGLGYTKGFCTWGEGPVAPAAPHRYLNHPPLIAVWTAGAFALLGEHEWAARLVPIAATLGGAALLMMMASRLVSAGVGVLAGVFYVTLPITAYFGRMLDHVALVQFFSLLMMHGYLQWTGVYGRRRAMGAVWYAVGAVLGIGSGWGAVFGAGLVVAMEVGRRVRGRETAEGERGRGGDGEMERRGDGRTEGQRDSGMGGQGADPPFPFLPQSRSPSVPLSGANCPLWALAGIPAIAMGAVVLHILWGFEWDAGALRDLFWSRTAGGAGESWAWWASGQWEFLLENYTWAGAAAVAVWLAASAWAMVVSRRTGVKTAAQDLPYGMGRGRSRGLTDAALGGGMARAVFGLLGLHGLLYVLAFRGPASHHEYWQMFTAPFVAVAMASVIALAYVALANRGTREGKAGQDLPYEAAAPRAATAVALLLVVAPMPGFMFGRDEYYHAVQMPERYLEPYRVLADLVPPGSPAMVSRDWPVSTEKFGQHANVWGVAQILYYADRPLINTRNLDEVLANAAGCSAYVLEIEDDPDLVRLGEALGARYRSICVGNHHQIFLLREPRAGHGVHG